MATMRERAFSVRFRHWRRTFLFYSNDLIEIRGACMKYCKNCGKQLSDDAKFCVDCGTPTEEASSKRRVEQAGTIYKCPNCGEVLESMTAVCPACGYEIRNTKASTASKEFSEKLSVLTSSEQKISLIQSFPIPNTKSNGMKSSR